MPTTKIGIAPLLQGLTGSVALPGVKLCCPQCGQEAADFGQCLVEMVLVSEQHKNAASVVRLQTDCRSCQYVGEPGFQAPVTEVLPRVSRENSSNSPLERL